VIDPSVVGSSAEFRSRLPNCMMDNGNGKDEEPKDGQLPVAVEYDTGQPKMVKHP